MDSVWCGAYRQSGIHREIRPGTRMGFSFHENPDCNRILNLINQDSRDLVGGVSLQLIAYHWSLMQGDETGLADAYERLIGESLIREVGDRCLLTPTGYAQLLDPECAEVEVESASELHRHGGRPTEYSLRAVLLDVLTRGGGKSVRLDELTERWAVSGLRAGELRDAIDLLIRDQLASLTGLRRRSLTLTKDGTAYVNGRKPPQVLIQMAPPLDESELRSRGVEARTLCMLAAYATGEAAQTRSVSFGEVSYRLERLKIPTHRVFHAIELAHRLGHIDFDDDTQTIHLTRSGDKLYRAANGRAVQWAIGQAVREA